MEFFKKVLCLNPTVLKSWHIALNPFVFWVRSCSFVGLVRSAVSVICDNCFTAVSVVKS